jgi:hypothetical protein
MVTIYQTVRRHIQNDCSLNVRATMVKGALKSCEAWTLDVGGDNHLINLCTSIY